MLYLKQTLNKPLAVLAASRTRSALRGLLATGLVLNDSFLGPAPRSKHDRSLKEVDSHHGSVSLFGMDVYQYTKRINECTKAGNMNGAMHLFNTMRQQGIKPNAITYNIMMVGFSKADDADSVHRLFDELIRAGIKPNLYIFNTSIRACAINVDLSRAARLFSRMQQRYRLTPNRWAYNSFLHVCAVAGQPSFAKMCVDKMDDRSISKNVVTYTSLIDAYAEGTNESNGQLHLSEAMSVLKKMKSEGIHPNVHTFGVIIKLCVRAKLVQQALDIVQDMEKDGLRPGVFIYSMLIDGLAKDPSISKERATSLLHWVLDEMKKNRIPIENETYSALINLCCKIEDLKLAESFFSKVNVSRKQSSTICLSSMLKCFERLGDPSNKEAYLKPCFALAKDMNAAGLTSVEIYPTLIAACSRAGDVDQAVRAFNDAQQTGVRCDMKLFGAMIKAFLKADELERALAFLKDMESKGIIRNNFICVMFLRHFATRHLKEHAERFIKEMKSLGVKQTLDSKTAK